MSITPSEPSRSLAALLALDDAVFLSTAYLWILGRPIDPAGFRDYELRLRTGTSRLQIVADLRSSPEGLAAAVDLPGLAEHLAALRPSGQPPGPGTASIQAIFRLHEGPFVEALAQHVLGLPLSEIERERLVTRLQAGTPRMVLLAEFMARRKQVPVRPIDGWDAVKATLQTGLCPVAVDCDDLLSFHDQDFVDCAYKTLVGRRPDPSGMAHYTTLLRSGHSKVSVLARLSRSPEARGRAQSLPGLRPAVTRYLLGRVPVLGLLTRAMWGTDGESVTERRLRALDNQLARLLQAAARERLAAEAASEAVDRLLAGGSA
jgi:hypothetical protein